MAVFRELAPNSGFDGALPSGGQGVMVPHRKSTLVVLEGGKDLDVSSTMRAKVPVHELREAKAKAAAHRAANPAEAARRLKDGSWRIFEITGRAPVTYDVVKIQAKPKARSRSSGVELKVLVLKKKVVKVAIRAVRVRDANQRVVDLALNPATPQALLDQMNAIWNPQANVYFGLGQTDPVTIDGLKPQADIDFADWKTAFKAGTDPKSELTFFLVFKVNNAGQVDNGATVPEERVSLIADSRSESTMAHEAGHFLGYRKGTPYGHPPNSQDMLMHVSHTGTRIPYSDLNYFNPPS